MNNSVIKTSENNPKMKTNPPINQTNIQKNVNKIKNLITDIEAEKILD
jgi:hypothetical protein